MIKYSRKAHLVFTIFCVIQIFLSLAAWAVVQSQYKQAKAMEYAARKTLYYSYVLDKSEYNELRQDGKVWAYVRKDGKL